MYILCIYNMRYECCSSINVKLFWSHKLVMGPSPGPARARPGPVHFSRDRARNFEKGPSSTQARDRFLEKGLENWDFYVVKNTGSSRLGIELLWRAWARARLEIDIQGSGSARDRFFRARPITSVEKGFCIINALIWLGQHSTHIFFTFCDPLAIINIILQHHF